MLNSTRLQHDACEFGLPRANCLGSTFEGETTKISENETPDCLSKVRKKLRATL